MRNYKRSAQTESIPNLSNVKDPEATFAEITRKKHMNYEDKFKRCE